MEQTANTEQPKTKEIFKNIGYSFAAQGITMLINVIFGLVVPKLIDEYQYAYWQTYVLYVGYVGILHFGILEGILLRYSQYNFNQLDKPRLRSQFQILQILNIICFGIAVTVSSAVFDGPWQIIAYLVAIGIITKNMFTYSCYILQSTNRVKYYALFNMVQKIVCSVVVIILLVMHIGEFYWYCIADVIGDIISILYGLYLNKGLYYGKGIYLHEALKETKENATAGAMLLLANVSSQLLIASAKIVTQWRWNELVFGKVSFAFSLANAFLVFANAISVVLFPMLKRTSSEVLPQLYKRLRGVISPVLFVVLILYFPGCWILSHWLPKYGVSLTYLGILLPIIIFTSKVNLLTNNYLKAYRKEREMLVINITTAIIAIILFLFAAYCLSNVDLLLVAAVLVIMGRSISSEIVVMRTIGISFVKEFIVEAIITILFIVIVGLASLWMGMLLYMVVLCAYAIWIKRIRQASI